MENPNLQNVSKEKVLLNPYPIPARQCFGPRPGFIFLDVDYAGIELRLLVHYSQEPEMVKLLRANGDGHALAAELFYGSRYTQACQAEKDILRSAAKNCNFAIPYGAGDDTVASTLGLTRQEGAAALARYRARWPLLGGLSNIIAETVTDQGFIEDVFGRRYRVYKPYVGLNYLIQGTAAQLLKRAEIRVHKLNETTGQDVSLVLPIHDELISEYARKRLKSLHEYLPEMRKVMVDFPQFSVPLDVDASLSTVCWAKKTKVKIVA